MPSPKGKELIILDKIKKLAVTAMFSHDDLMDQLVLNGGNAMALNLCCRGTCSGSGRKAQQGRQEQAKEQGRIASHAWAPPMEAKSLAPSASHPCAH